MACVPSLYLLQQILINAEAGTPSPGLAGIFHGAKMMLYTTNVALTVNTVKSDLTEATYNTYVQQAAAFSAPFQSNRGGVGILSAMLNWQMTDNLVPNTIFGYAIVDSGNTHLLLAESFGAGGIPLDNTLKAINVACEFLLGGPDWGTMSLEY